MIYSIPKVDLRAVSLLLRSRANVHAIGGVFLRGWSLVKGWRQSEIEGCLSWPVFSKVCQRILCFLLNGDGRLEPKVVLGGNAPASPTKWHV